MLRAERVVPLIHAQGRIIYLFIYDREGGSCIIDNWRGAGAPAGSREYADESGDPRGLPGNRGSGGESASRAMAETMARLLGCRLDRNGRFC